MVYMSTCRKSQQKNDPDTPARPAVNWNSLLHKQTKFAYSSVSMDKSNFRNWLKNTSLTFRIVSGLVLGVLCGLFFGEKAESLQWIADVWIRLMQMTVLPYVTLSLIAGLGQLDARLARRLAVSGGLLLVLFWGIAFIVITVMPLALPAFENAAFFSSAAGEQRGGFNPIDLYIPSNPFHSLANTIIPAVVLFSSAIGVALISMPEKANLIDTLNTFIEAVSRVTRFVVGLTPIGVFAIVAVAAGTMGYEQILRLEAYFIMYIAASLYLALWVLPLLISMLTPFKYRDIFRYSKEALITAFVAQNVFIILPMLIDTSRKLFADYGIRSDETDSLSEVIVPVTFNFPNAGKLLSLLFIPFVAWMIGTPMPLADYPAFLLSGLASYFAKAQIALPFLLDLQRLPQDLFQLYLPTGIVNGKFDTMVSAMNLLAFSVIGAAALTGNIRLRATAAVRFLGASLLVLFLVVAGTRALLSQLIDTEYRQDEVILSMHAMIEKVPTKVHMERPGGIPFELTDGTLLERIEARGVLRVGYDADRLPYTFFNADGQLVGFDVELLNILALEMGVSLEFIPVTWDTLQDQLNSGEIDVMGTIPLSTHMLMGLDLSDPYTTGILSMVVRDHRRADFSTPEGILQHDKLVIAYPGPITFIKESILRWLPADHVEWRHIQSFEEFFEQEGEEYDALMVEAEIGTAWTLLHPEYDAVLPQGARLKMPAGFAVAKGEHDFAALLGRWLAAKESTGEIARAYEYWVLGKGAEPTEPRWSIGKDVLGWFE